VEKTAQAFIHEAMRLVGILGEGATASATQAADALEILNQWIDSCNAEKTMLFTSGRAEYALTANDAQYSIGSGGDFDQTRPLWIDEARIIPDDTVAAAAELELPCAVLTPAQWRQIRLKNMTSTHPWALFYDKGLDNNERGVITFWPVPTSSDVAVVLYTPTALTSFAALTTAYKFAPGYARAIKYNLAVELAANWSKPLPPYVERIAIESKALLETVNLEIPELRCDPGIAAGGGRGGYDVRSGRG
jgi:hypothetical protein